MVKNEFQISTRLSRYSPASAAAAKTYSTDGITIKIVITIQSPTHYGKESGGPKIMDIVKYSINILIHMAEFYFHKKGIFIQQKFVIQK